MVSKKAGFYFRIKSAHIFERQVYGFLRGLGAEEDVYVITLPETETSHLRIINEISGIKKIRTFCFIPETEKRKSEIKLMKSCGYGEVNAL